MRIEQVDLDNVKINRVDQEFSSFHQLKILIIRSLPEQTYYEAVACRIATQIASQHLPTLWIIVINQHNIWVSSHREVKAEGQANP